MFPSYQNSNCISWVSAKCQFYKQIFTLLFAPSLYVSYFMYSEMITLWRPGSIFPFQLEKAIWNLRFPLILVFYVTITNEHDFCQHMIKCSASATSWAWFRLHSYSIFSVRTSYTSAETLMDSWITKLLDVQGKKLGSGGNLPCKLI